MSKKIKAAKPQVVEVAPETVEQPKAKRSGKHAAPEGGAPVAPLTLEQRAQLGDKKAIAEMEKLVAKFDELTGADKVVAKLAKKQQAKKSKTKRDPSEPRDSALNHAVTILQGSKEPLSCKEIIAAMESKKLWKSPSAKAPHEGLYVQIRNEIVKKGKESRFVKAAPGRFALAK